jgi:hypothetical protein
MIRTVAYFYIQTVLTIYFTSVLVNILRKGGNLTCLVHKVLSGTWLFLYSLSFLYCSSLWWNYFSL